MTAELLLLGAGTGAIALVLVSRWLDGRHWARSLVAFRLTFPRGLTPQVVADWLAAVAASTRHQPVVLEVEARQDQIRHYLLVPTVRARFVTNQLRSLLPGVRFEQDEQYLAEHSKPTAASEVRLSSTSHPLSHDEAETLSHALLSSLQPLGPSHTLRLSWMLSGTPFPHPLGLTKLPPDLARFRRTKHRAPLLRACGRISVTGGAPRIARTIVHRVTSTLRILDAPGAALHVRSLPLWVVNGRVQRRSLPITIWPAILNTHELAGALAIPFGITSKPGLPAAGSRLLPPPQDMPRRGLVLTHATFPGQHARPLALDTSDRVASSERCKRLDEVGAVW